ncbi:MAG: flagellar protein FlaG [Epsilonproteobacteria bacterium]|nr:flagellar protein FlaG [Campylobacterota bacterium]
MESTMITPSTQNVASTTFTPRMETRVEAKSVQQTKIEAKPQNSPETSAQGQQPNLEKVSQEFNQMSNTLNLDVKFAYNDKIDTVYVNVTDKNTGQVIRKLPSEDAMKIKESMKDLVGVLFDKKG